MCAQQHHSNPAYYDRLFDAIAELVIQARHEITHSTGSPANLGALNGRRPGSFAKKWEFPALSWTVSWQPLNWQALLAQSFAAAAEGGNMIALVNAGQCEFVRQALREGGAVQTYITELKQGS